MIKRSGLQGRWSENPKNTGFIGEVREIGSLNQNSHLFEKRLRGLIDQLPIGIHIVAPSGDSLLSNRAWWGLWNREEAGSSQPNVFQDERLEDVGLIPYIERSVREGALTTPPLCFEIGGEIVGWRRILVSPIQGDSGELEEIALFAEDVGEYVKARSRLEESQERFEQIFNQSIDALLIHDYEGRIVDCNREAYRSLGYTKEELLGLSVGDIATDVLSEKEKSERLYTPWRTARVLPAGTTVGFHQNAHRRKNQTTFPVEVGIGSVDYDGQRMILASCRDATRRVETEGAVRASEAHYRAVVDGAHDAIITIDASGEIRSFNRGARRTFGYEPDEICGVNLTRLMPERFRAAHRVGIERYLATHEPRILGKTLELYGLRKNDEEFPLELTITEIRIEDEDLPLFTGIIRDITERKRSEAALKESQALLRNVTNSAPVILFMLGLDGVFTVSEGRGLEKIGAAGGDFVGQCLYDVLPPGASGHASKIARAISGEEISTEEEYAGRIFDIRYTPVRDESGVQTGVAGLAVDITGRKKLEARLTHQALHDDLTGLANRALLLNRLEQSLLRVENHCAEITLLYVDLDNFKYVNDTLGHAAGDVLLMEVADRLKSCVREYDTVARLGGDEFVVLLEGVEDFDHATGSAERISNYLKDPFYLEGRELVVTASIGVAVCSSGGSRCSATEMLSNADVAMYTSKNAGKDGYAVFEPKMAERSARRLGLESDLRRAVSRSEFFVVYQPKIDVKTESIVGFEALVRWRHPERGVIPPNSFIPVAEETGLIREIGAQVLLEACNCMKSWEMKYPLNPHLTMNVNASAVQIQSSDFVQEVENSLRASGLDASRLIVEVTESAVMSDPQAATSVLERLRRLGVRIALDDFGTGYSSLSHLRKLPVDVLKVDRSLISDIHRDTGNLAIVLSTVTLARSLGLTIVAEGVENENENAKVNFLDFDEVQGYFWHPPLPEESVEKLLGELPRTP